MNSTQFVDMVQEARANDLKVYNADNTAFGPDFDPTILTDPLAYSADGTNTVWLDQIFRTAPINNYELNLKGGNEKTKFYIGAGYFDQQGIVIENYYKRMNARVNIDHSINDKFSVGVNLSMSKSLNHRSFNDVVLPEKPRHRGQAGDVQLHHREGRVERCIEERSLQSVAGVVDQDVDRDALVAQARMQLPNCR